MKKSSVLQVFIKLISACCMLLVLTQVAGARPILLGTASYQIDGLYLTGTIHTEELDEQAILALLEAVPSGSSEFEQLWLAFINEEVCTRQVKRVKVSSQSEETQTRSLHEEQRVPCNIEVEAAGPLVLSRRLSNGSEMSGKDQKEYSTASCVARCCDHPGCDYVAASPSNLMIHRRIHTGDRPFACMHCSKAFSRKSNLTQHERKEHASSQLDESVTAEHDLLGHKPIVYENRPCDSFEWKSRLMHQVMVAQETLPYSCSYCKSTFRKKSKLDKHIDSEHEKRRHACSQCDQTFSAKSSLNSHVKSIHLGQHYQCQHCEKIFSYLRGLKVHVKTVHGGDRREVGELEAVL